MANVYKLKKLNKKKHRLLKFVVSILILAVISVIAVLLVTNNGKMGLDGFLRFFKGAGGQTEATEFSFDAGAGSVYAEMEGGLAVCSGGGLQVYAADAKKAFSEAFDMSDPALISNGETGAAYDLGGTALKLFDQYGVKKDLTTDGKIVSASLNKNGWLAVCTEESSAYKGLVTVFDDKADKQYYWYSAEGYVLSAAVSPDNKSLAVLTLTDGGSKIVFFSLDSTEVKASCTFSGELVLDIKYISDGRVLALSRSALHSVKQDGSTDVLYEYSDKYLAGYSVDGDGFTALVLNDYLVGDKGNIVTVDQGGKVLGTAQTSSKVLSVSARGNDLAVLYSDCLVIYDRNMKEGARFNQNVGAGQTIMLRDRKAVLITPHSATVCSVPTG